MDYMQILQAILAFLGAGLGAGGTVYISYRHLLAAHREALYNNQLELCEELAERVSATTLELYHELGYITGFSEEAAYPAPTAARTDVEWTLQHAALEDRVQVFLPDEAVKGYSEYGEHLVDALVALDAYRERKHSFDDARRAVEACTEAKDVLMRRLREAIGVPALSAEFRSLLSKFPTTQP